MLDYFQLKRKLLEDVPVDNKQSIDGGQSYFIPIEVLEDLLDDFDYSTKNFQFNIYKDGYANLCVAASLELTINYTQNNSGDISQRTVIGACNFPLGSLGANQHFLATAKSECMKNAASDFGKWLGRGLNTSADHIPDIKGAVIVKKDVKKKADSKIMRQFLAAVESGDEQTQIILSNIYEIKTQADVEEK